MTRELCTTARYLPTLPPAACHSNLCLLSFFSCHLCPSASAHSGGAPDDAGARSSGGSLMVTMTPFAQELPITTTAAIPKPAPSSSIIDPRQPSC